MKISGMIRSSMIDYPGKISCVLFTQGCNFYCPYCHNPDLVPMTSGTSELLGHDAVFAFLEKRAGMLDGVVITGGEPTLHKKLISFCKKVKKMGYSLKLDTNGSRPQVLRCLIEEGLLDYIAMDIKTDPFGYAPIITDTYKPEDIIASIRIIMESTMSYEFRTTCTRPFVDADIVAKIARAIEGANLFALQAYNPNTVLNPEFFNGKNDRVDLDELEAYKVIAEPFVKECLIR